MPELPEVETIRRSLIPLIKGKKILKLEVFHPAVLINEEGFSLENYSFDILARRGKFLIFKLSQKDQPELALLIHLRMTGKIIYQDSLSKRDKHTHLRFFLNDDHYLDFNDVRRFGRAIVIRKNELQNLKNIRKLGPEPLSQSFIFEDFYQKLKKRKTASIKASLLDQGIVAGLGNIYVDEVLFRSRIRPDFPASQLSKEQALIIHQEIKSCLKEAIGHRGTSFKDYVDGLGKSGFFQLKLKVYQRTNQDCYLCGNKIQRMKIAGRSTHYCQHCQS